MAVFEPGVPTAVFARLNEEFEIRGRIALTPVADAIIRQAKTNASVGSHAYGTPTPARPGTGPARISGTLVRSIDRGPVTRHLLGWAVQVGMTAGQYPTYRTRKSSSQYARILEVDGCRDGSRYPFLYAAAEFVFAIAATVIYTEKYGTGWRRIA